LYSLSTLSDYHRWFSTTQYNFLLFSVFHDINTIYYYCQTFIQREPGSGRKCRPHAARTIYSELLGCKQIRNPMSCDGDEDDSKKK